MLHMIYQVVVMLRLTIIANPLVSATVGQRPFYRLIGHISNLPTILKAPIDDVTTMWYIQHSSQSKYQSTESHLNLAIASYILT